MNNGSTGYISIGLNANNASPYHVNSLGSKSIN
jgi:hypothetical protein